ncbi:hypothetical protein KM043_007092 [Ampulex compressa]|nr:hypothetical protein KM043_007092 [Ampulex compressa]
MGRPPSSFVDLCHAHSVTNFFSPRPPPGSAPLNFPPLSSNVAGFADQSIPAARLSTHIFDCSANMPEFVLWAPALTYVQRSASPGFPAGPWRPGVSTFPGLDDPIKVRTGRRGMATSALDLLDVTSSAF